ncbi:U-box domain-containing protein [Pseudomassariella vexata]|uniref:U-box domain-containing protein n=1 Tax=Pseudomassariella vexata TaxID=1141098 RepID=A0A1Y2DG34_9PEZI|nr:U-box domain-containing protein [Pseudomassariella vexata]ORY58189.1 U-box domain-containing protein [Pseudomassariella vexata]
MPRDPDRAGLLKNDGNKYFQSGDYVGAESMYSKALTGTLQYSIIADDTNPALYTNRAMARLKLKLWDSAIADCEACLKLNDESMKAHYYLAQAHSELHDYEEALSHAIKAHSLCVITNDKSLTQVTTLVLNCKKARWEEMEKKRIREDQELEKEVISMMEQEKDDMIATCDNEGDRKQVAQEWEHKISILKKTFDKARSEFERRRVVPDWAIDDISFGIMVDPVMTKTGKSYERASIMEHLRRHPTDPLTREPLLPNELRPNLGLKQACEEFLEGNGWAVDW